MWIYHPILRSRKSLGSPIFQIPSLSIEARGRTLSIEAKGHFSAEVKDGAYVVVTVKYGLITLIRQTADLCEKMKAVDEECPLDGEKVIRKEFQLPSRIPPVCEDPQIFSRVLILMCSQGRYTVLADVYTVEHVQITCLEAQMSF